MNYFSKLMLLSFLMCNSIYSMHLLKRIKLPNVFIKKSLNHNSVLMRNLSSSNYQQNNDDRDNKNKKKSNLDNKLFWVTIAFVGASITSMATK